METVEVTPARWNVAGWARQYYFRAAFGLIFALSLVASGDNLVTDVGQPSNSDPKMIVHGLFALAWVGALVLQAHFAATGNMRLHRRFGTAGFFAALGVALSTIYVFAAVWKGWDAMTPEVKANRILLPSFSIFVLLAYFNRTRPVIHKRLVYTGTLFLLSPILSRCFDPLILPLLPPLTKSQDTMAFHMFMVVTWSAFFASLFIYDKLILRRIHPISMTAYAWLLVVIVFAELI